MHKPVVFIVCLFCCVSSEAQTDTGSYSRGDHINLKLSSSSSLIDPGISTGIEFPVQVVKMQKRSGKSNHSPVRKERFISGNLSWYHHPGFHDNIYLTSEWVMRRNRPGGFFSDISCGPGFSRTFLAGTTYMVNNTGDISIVKNAGYSYALLTIGGGIGCDFWVREQLPFSVYSKMNVISMFPYNSTIYFRPVLELGIQASPEKIKEYFNTRSALKR